MLRIEIARRSVFLCRKKPAHQPLASALGGAFGEMSEKCGFYCSSYDAAAQQEGVHFALLAFVVRDRDPDYPVVAKTIAHPDGKYMPARLFSHLRDLWLSVAPGGQVELAGFLRQLRDPRQRQVRHGFQFGFLLEEAKEIFLRLKVLLGAGALLLRSIHLGALLVFGRKGQPLERRTIPDSRRILQRILSEINDRNFGKRGANLLALKGIVVEKGERVDAHIQFLR